MAGRRNQLGSSQLYLIPKISHLFPGWVPQPAPACRGVSLLKPGILLANADFIPSNTQVNPSDPREREPVESILLRGVRRARRE
jgi:hypothetical protein